MRMMENVKNIILIALYDPVFVGYCASCQNITHNSDKNSFQIIITKCNAIHVKKIIMKNVDKCSRYKSDLK